MDARSPTAINSREEDAAKLVRACAEACGLAAEFVEKICKASPEQVHRMDHHIETGGSYMMQMVLQYEGDLKQTFMLGVLSAMRFKNHILRTRLVKHEGHVYQVVLRDSIVFQVPVDLVGYLIRNSRTLMDYGTSLFRYAFIREPRGEAFFVWTAHCSAIDAWTLRLVFDDFQFACSDLAAYSKRPSRPPHGRYVRWLESYNYEAGSRFWLTHHTPFDGLVHEFPVLGQGDLPSMSTRKIKKLLHLPRVEHTRFSLPIIGHAAWALSIANCKTQDNAPLLNEDISFISTSSARRTNISEFMHIMGPISARVPLRVRLFPNLPIEDLLRDIETQFSSMIGFEHCAMRALSKETDSKHMLKQAVFNWNPPGSDISSKRIVCHDKHAAPAILAYREDLSVPFANDYGLMFEVYDHGEYIAMNVTWDPDLVSVELLGPLCEGFESFLVSIMKNRGVTVLELLSKIRACQSAQWTTFQPQRAGVLR